MVIHYGLIKISNAFGWFSCTRIYIFHFLLESKPLFFFARMQDLDTTKSEQLVKFVTRWV